MTPRKAWMLKVLTRMLQGSPDREADSFKKPRRSSRISQKVDGVDQSQPHQKTPISNRHNLPSPVTGDLSNETTTGDFKEATATPPDGRPGQTITHHRNGEDGYSQVNPFSSPPGDTQAFSQFTIAEQNATLSDEVEDEVKEGVFGYLFPLDTKYGGPCVVLRNRAACPSGDTTNQAIDAAPVPTTKKQGRKDPMAQEEKYEETKERGLPSGGYLIGRHPECGRFHTLTNALILQRSMGVADFAPRYRNR